MKMRAAAKHTPAPWEAGTTSNPRAIVKMQRNGTALPIAHMNKSLWDENNPRRIADLALLAAAPELLNALETLREDLRMLRDGEWVPDGSGDAEQCSIDAADAAIAKAKGEA
jgi:hypothetical protein